MAATSLKWIEKSKRVYDRLEQKIVGVRFLRCQVIDEYNNGMNGVDVSDQLRGSYRIDRWMKKGNGGGQFGCGLCKFYW